jgi:hypothetical protein
MEIEFICLYKLGVGPVLVRFEDIITIEITPMNYTRIEFGYGEHLIVEETPAFILGLIRRIKEYNQAASESSSVNPEQ